MAPETGLPGAMFLLALPVPGLLGATRALGAVSPTPCRLPGQLDFELGAVILDLEFHMRLGEKHRQIGLSGVITQTGVIAALHWPRSPRPGHLGYAGRRVPVSRKWSGKTLKDHRGDRNARLIATLSLEPPDPASTSGETRASDTRPYRHRTRR